MQEIILERKKVYDPFLRVIHAWNGIIIVLLIITGELKKYLPPELGHKVFIISKIHTVLGIGLCIGLGLRILWGIVGPKSACFKDLWHPKIWWDVIKTRRLYHYDRFGHDVYSSLAYLGVYGLLLIQCISGLLLGPFRETAVTHLFAFELLKEAHLIINYALLIFILVHITMLIVHESLEKIPLAQSMISGFQYRKKAQK